MAIKCQLFKDFAFGSSLFEAVKLTTNADPNKYKYSGYGIGFDASGSFSLSDGRYFGKNVIIFEADMNSLKHIDYKKKDVLILGKDPIQSLNDTSLTAIDYYKFY